MISIDIIEDKKYTFSMLKQVFSNNEEKTYSILKKLKEYSILKVRPIEKNNNLSNLIEGYFDEITDVERNNYNYIFKYVGIIIIQHFVIKCYPKYLNNPDNNSFKEIIKVIKKYSKTENQVINLQYNLNKEYNFNLLSIMLYFIEDYYRNGIYTNSENIIEINGSKEILWEKTINETYALIHENKPYYINLYTENKIIDDKNYFKLLHEVILTRCSKELERFSLLDLFDLTFLNLNNQDLNNFGSQEYIKSKITKELSIQFNSHKQSLLKAMYAYIDHENSYLGNINDYDIYGTNSYNLIWEKMCSYVFNNKINKTLGDLELEFPNSKIHQIYDKDQKLLSVIEKPTWHLVNDNLEECVKSRTLIPDIISFNHTNQGVEFIIIDAKYYDLDQNKPGIEDISKQYLYELSYKKFIELNDFNKTKNCFILPTNEEKIINKGYVEFKTLKNLGLENIQIILLPAKLINKLYLENKQLDILELNL